MGHRNTANGYWALTGNKGSLNSAFGAEALRSNSTGEWNTAVGSEALYSMSTGRSNTALGYRALVSSSTASKNVAVGAFAGSNSTGAFNVFLGADVVGTTSDANTMRLGRPYDSATGEGQNQTFIAGVWGNQVSGTAAQVFVDANGRLGTGTPVTILNGTATLVTPAAVEQQLQEQQKAIALLQAANANLQARLAVLEAERAAGPRRR